MISEISFLCIRNYGTNTTSFVGPKLRDKIPVNVNSLMQIEIPQKCLCRICIKYIKDLHFCDIVNSI